MTNKAKGSIAELQVAAWLASNGYVVSFPAGDNAPYDLIVETTRGCLLRLQIRSTSWVGNELRLKVSGYDNQPMDLSRVDFFILVDNVGGFYTIPTKRVADIKSAFKVSKNPASTNFYHQFQRLPE